MPTQSMPQGCGAWHETKATYRFFDNERVEQAKLVAGQRAACVERIKAHFDFSPHLGWGHWKTSI